MTSSHSNILIIGAGIFGTSTAYHLSLSSCSKTITILDRAPCPSKKAASTDINKIVRADYTDAFHMRLAYETVDAWRSWGIFDSLPDEGFRNSEEEEEEEGKEGKGREREEEGREKDKDKDENNKKKGLYHRSGWIMLDEKGSNLATQIRKNFKNSNREDETRDLNWNEIKTGFGNMFSKLDTSGFENAYWNPGAGWADAGDAVRVIMNEAVKRGVRYVVGEVEEILLMDEEDMKEEGGKGCVKGVKTIDGRIFTADKILLATGAWTSSLMSGLEDRLGFKEEFRIERQIRAVSVCVAHFRLREEEMGRYRDMPVLVYGDYGEILPPTHTRLLKVNFSAHITNTISTPTTNHLITLPPPQSQNVVPDSLKKETLNFVKRALPDLLNGGREVEYWRLCWDSVSPTQNPLLTRHPSTKLKNLYFAIGGSFHSWKFLPIIGRYVMNVLEGRSNGEEMDGRWGWKEGVGERWGWEDGEGDGEKKTELRDLELGGGEIFRERH
ncbi:MAG: hypothetical protein M1812_005162 [Candelaria pacifica]|nr:MAG: hypothetical protein M1812_005162 [Candelaria pacifica]